MVVTAKSRYTRRLPVPEKMGVAGCALRRNTALTRNTG